MPAVSVSSYPGNKVITASAGGILIDVRSGTNYLSVTSGTVTINGNLNVLGIVTNVDSTNTNIADNIITLNKGETNAYVTRNTAGIEIDRSSGGFASLLWDDTLEWSYDNITTATRGLWTFKINNAGSGIQTSALRADLTQGNWINFLGIENPTGVLNVKGTTDYELQVIDDDDIPNKKYVDDLITLPNNIAEVVRVGFSSVRIYDNQVTPVHPFYDPIPSIVGALGTDTNYVFRFESANAFLQGIQIADTNLYVSAGRTSEHMVLRAFNTGSVWIESPLALRNSEFRPTPLSNSTHIYTTSTVGGGGTGIYYSNAQREDELISKKRAIIFSIIF